MLSEVLAIILGGGRGERLYPLTRERSKPAVPFGGKYRLVDIPISNCIHSGFNRIYLLTQFNSSSLHNHIAYTYIFDSFSNGFVEILAAEQTFEHTSWYKGTADAVRQNFIHFRTQNPGHYLILSGDQLYRMDLADFFHSHLESEAEISVAVTPVPAERVSQLGILQVDASNRVTSFLEKPPPDQDISSFQRSPSAAAGGGADAAARPYLASMGIYLFKTGILKAALDNQMTDFGKEIIPAAIGRFKVNAYVFNGFWEDIGTIKSFYETNIALTSLKPDFDFYDMHRPIYTRRRDLPASKINSSTITQTLTADGCIITNANIMHSIIGIRTIIESGASLDGVFSMGADFYETPEQKTENARLGLPDIGIGRGSLIRRAIIDKNARIGEVCRIGVDDIARTDGDYDHYHIREGIIIIPKNGVISTGTVI
jgi:glucose-1-phosphate adenylyltransferase